MSSGYYDIELIDVDPNVDNFSFERISKDDLESIVQSFKDNKPYLEFDSSDGQVILERKYFRGVMHTLHAEKKKSVVQETLENAEEIGKIEIVQKQNKPKVISKEK